MLTVIKQFHMWLQVHRNDEGATAVEYGLMIALIAGAIILTVALLGGNLNDLFGNVNDQVETGVTNSTPTP